MDTPSDTEARVQRLSIPSSAGNLDIDVTGIPQPLTARTLSRLITEQKGNADGTFLLYRFGDTDSQEHVPLYSCDVVDASSVFVQYGVKRLAADDMMCDAIMQIADGVETDTPDECMVRIHLSNSVLEMYFTQTTNVPTGTPTEAQPRYTTRLFVWTPHDPTLPASRFELHRQYCHAALGCVAKLKQWRGLEHILHEPFRVNAGIWYESKISYPGVFILTSQTTGREIHRSSISRDTMRVSHINGVSSNGLLASRFNCVQSCVNRDGEICWKMDYLPTAISDVCLFDTPRQAYLARSVMQKCVMKYAMGAMGVPLRTNRNGWGPSMPFPPHEILQRPDWLEAYERLCNILSQSTQEEHLESLLCIRLSVAVDAIVRDATTFDSLSGTVDDLTARLPQPSGHIAEMVALWKAFRAAYAPNPENRLHAVKRPTDSQHTLYESCLSMRHELREYLVVFVKYGPGAGQLSSYARTWPMRRDDVECVVLFNEHPNDAERSMYELGRLPKSSDHVRRSLSHIPLRDDAEVQFVLSRERIAWYKRYCKNAVDATAAKRSKQQTN